jgi:hypothetical protein
MSIRSRSRESTRDSNDLDTMCGDPDVQLVEASLEGFLEIAHSLPVLRAILEVKARPQKLILVQRALLEPEPSNRHRIRTHGAEATDELIVRLDELLSLDWTSIVIEQREQDFEPDHGRP